MTILELLILLVIGIFAGAYGTLVGAGGGFIFVPALILLFSVEPATAAGTGLVIVLINALSGIYGYAKQRRIDYATGFKIVAGAVPGSIFGVWLIQVYSSEYFNVIFAIILIILGIFLFIKNSPWKKALIDSSIDTQVNINTHPMKLILLGLFMGILSSYLGIGGGWLLVPILIYVFGLSTHRSTATSIFTLCLYSAVGVVSQMYYNGIDWVIVIWGGIGVTIGAQLGVYISAKISGRLILQLLSVLLLIIGIQMYIN